MTRFYLLTLLLPAFLTPAMAGELKIGDALPSLALKDQYGRPHTNDNALRFLVFAPDRASAQVVTDTFKDQTASGLQGRGITYVADIEKMPSLVASLLALPKMRKEPYPILLGRTASDTAMLPRQAGCVTVIASTNGHITSITFPADPAGLRQALKLDPAVSRAPPGPGPLRQSAMGESRRDQDSKPTVARNELRWVDAANRCHFRSAPRILLI